LFYLEINSLRFIVNDPVQGQSGQDSLITGGWGPVGMFQIAIIRITDNQVFTKINF
jgi:hypothetical protein